MKINEPDVADEEDDEFYDAGEVAHNSSDISPPDQNFSVAQEDIPTDYSDQSEPIASSRPFRENREVEPVLGNSDDADTEAVSDVDGNDSPRASRFLLDDDKVSERSSRNELSTECQQNEKPTGESTYIENTSDEPNEESTEKSQDDLNINSCSRSSMEVMEDDSDSSKNSSPVKVASKPDGSDENSKDADSAETSLEIPTENDGTPDEKITESEPVEKITESETPSANADEDGSKIAEVGDILTLEDSDVDESLQENLDVALKVVEESSPSSSPDDESVPAEAASKTENILEEFQEDAAQVNGDTSELLEGLSPCQVVLFKIDLDDYALKFPIKTESAESIVSDSSVKSTKSPRTCRVLTKAAKKMMISSSDSSEEIPRRARGSSTNSSPSSERQTPRRPARGSRSTKRPRRSTRDVNQGAKYTCSTSALSDGEENVPLTSLKKRSRISNSPDSEENVPLTSLSKKRKAASSIRRSSRPIRKSTPEKDSSEEISCDKTLKCVSVPDISVILDSVKHKSSRLLIALLQQKEDEYRSRATKEAKPKGKSTARGSRRRKLSSSDTSKVTTEDESSGKRSPRKSAKGQTYVEASESDDESPKAKTRKRNSTPAKRSERESDGEEADSSSKFLWVPFFICKLG